MFKFPFQEYGVEFQHGILTALGSSFGLRALSGKTVPGGAQKKACELLTSKHIIKAFGNVTSVFIQVS